jgi:hypothetical protein
MVIIDHQLAWTRPSLQSLVNVVLALFILLIIRTFQLVFAIKIVFFSHNKSANSIFQTASIAKRNGAWHLVGTWWLIYCGILVSLGDYRHLDGLEQLGGVGKVLVIVLGHLQ